MKKQHVVLGVALGGLLALGALGSGTSGTEAGQASASVGTFDSRAVALAYVRSSEFGSYLRAQQADIQRALERAREAGDTELVADLEALGPAMQRRTHRQGFGSAAVDDILERIADRLPRIAKEAGVDLIVSKWVLTYSSPSAAMVDVTDRLVAEFHPDEKTRQVIEEILGTAPVPLDELTDH